MISIVKNNKNTDFNQKKRDICHSDTDADVSILGKVIGLSAACRPTNLIFNWEGVRNHMETLSIDLPAMYADHHVVEVRGLLMNLPGIDDVYASSAFHILRVRVDPAQINEAVIRSKLSEAGYLGELSIATEEWKTGSPKDTADNPFRHTAAYENIKSVAFAQQTEETGRVLWPCPGMGLIKKEEK